MISASHVERAMLCCFREPQLSAAPLDHPPRGRRGGLPRGIGEAAEALGRAVVGEAARGVPGEVGEDVVGLSDEGRRRPLQAPAEVLHGEGDVGASRRRRVHEAPETLLHRLHELGVGAGRHGQRVGDRLEEVGRVGQLRSRVPIAVDRAEALDELAPGRGDVLRSRWSGRSSEEDADRGLGPSGPHHSLDGGDADDGHGERVYPLPSLRAWHKAVWRWLLPRFSATMQVVELEKHNGGSKWCASRRSSPSIDACEHAALKHLQLNEWEWCEPCFLLRLHH